MQRSAGWYHDPVTIGAARYWDGTRWTHQVAWGGIVQDDPTPLAEVVRRDVRHDAETVGDYLRDAVRRDLLPAELADVLLADLDRREPEPAATRRTARPEPAAIDRDLPPPRTTHPAPSVALAAPQAASTSPLASSHRTPSPATAPEATPVAPGRVATWWADVQHAVRTDLALHGIAYLGVLLLFAGVTGLVVFSFGDVAPWVRSLTELLVPTALFLGAWYLTTRNADVVGRALELLGGVITPIVVAAAFTDGAPVPPDVDGRALPSAQAVGVAAVAIGMAFAVRRRPSSPLRYVVGPAVWFAAGLAAGALRTPVPTGYETAQPDALQLAVVLAAIASTLLVLVTLPDGALVDGTRRAALPMTAAVYLVELVLAGREGWPIASTLVAGLAAVVVLETEAKRLPALVVGGLQYGVVGIGALRLAAVTDPAWVAVGAFVVLLGLAEHLGHRRPEPVSGWIGIAASGGALLCTLVEPWSATVGFGLLATWGIWRHLSPAAWMPLRDRYGIVPAAGAGVAVVALSRSVDPAAVLVGTAAGVLLVAAAGRLCRRVTEDPLWSWFIPVAAGATVLASVGFEWGDASAAVASASAIAALAFAISPLSVAGRVWTAASASAWAAANGAQLVDTTRGVEAVVVAVVGAGLVMIALATSRPVWIHLAAVGHAAGIAALTIPEWPGWAATTAVTLLAAGWWTTAIVDERGEAPHLGAMRRAITSLDEPADTGPDVVAESWTVIAFGLLCAVTMSASASVDPSVTASWMAVVAAITITFEACLVRLGRWARTRHRALDWVLVTGAVFAAVTAAAEAGPDRSDWSAIAAATIVIAVVAIAMPPRPAPFRWTAWVASGVVTVLLGDRLGLARGHLDTLVAAWGAAALVGGAGARRAHADQWPAARGWRGELTVAPLCLGGLAFAVGGASALADGDTTTIGWTALAMAVVVTAVAVLLRLGVLTAIAEGLATVTYSLLAPWDPLARPVAYVPWVLLLLVTAQVTRGRRDGWSERWDLPAFITAHAVAVYALVLAVDTDSVAPTFTSVAAVAVCVAAVVRRVEWAIAAAVLLLVAGADAGHGWLALVLLIEGTAATVAGLRRTGVERWTLIAVGAAATIGAWFDMAAWSDLDADTFVLVTAGAGAALSFLAALASRAARVPREFVGTWVATGALVSIGSMTLGFAEVSRQAGGLTFAGATLLLAGTAVLLVPVLGTSMRWIASFLAASAWVPAAWAAEPTELVAAWVATGAALAVLGTALTVHGVRPGQPWIRPAAAFAVATQLLATVAAAVALPAEGPITLVLLAVAAELIALGVVTDRPVFFVLAPVAACGAWLVVARDALAGQPNWFTVPIGLTMLVMVGLVRWIRRGRGVPVTTTDVTVLEYVGMTVIVAPPLALTLSGALWNAFVAIIAGVLLTLWGATTRVTWRVVFGSATVVAAVVLVIAVPLSSTVTWRGPALWLALTLLGVVAIVVATTIERSRDAVRQIGHRLGTMTEDWERVPWRHRDVEPLPHPPDPLADSDVSPDHQPVG